MKRQLNLISTAGHLFFAIMIVLSLSMIVPTTVMAEKNVSYEGTLQGAMCVHYKNICPENDVHITIENDFVLLLSSGEHYFLPNINRAVKARHIGQPVRISGKQEGHEIWVENLDVKKDNTYRNVWSWEEQQKLYKMK